MNARSLCAALLLSAALAACHRGGGPSVTPVANTDYNDYRTTDPNAPPPPGGVGQASDSHQQETGGALGVNAYLWRGALDTLSFMPLASADPFGGVIITDWYAPPAANGERFKATAYILGRELRADGVRVVIFRQVRDAGQWVDAPVNPDRVTEIENKVLEHARELRAQRAGSK